MKENAPEKIYVQLPSRKWIGRIWNETPIKEGDNPNWKNATNIEYIRADAIIEKVEKFMKTVNQYLYHCVSEECDYVDTDKFIEGFKNYMKGE